MIKRRLFGIYGKVFFYTALILLFVIFFMFIFFFDQVKSVVESTQRQQISEVFQPLLNHLHGKSDDEIRNMANSFHEKNTSFEFCLEAANGQILYQTENFNMIQNDIELPPSNNVIVKGNVFTERKFHFITGDSSERFQFLVKASGGVTLYVTGTISGTKVYSEFIEKMVFAFVLIFMASLLAAALFARQIAKPIEKIAKDTKKMADLEPVPAPASRKDEIGQLAGDVYKMYKTLQVTIQQLEIEIEREKEMEENQRYFFSAASHELKTPIAATSALLEGMLEKVIAPGEYPEYLRECLKMMNEQNKLVSEILEIVTLSNDMTAQEQERINLNEFMTGILSFYRTLADVREQRIDVDIPENLCCTLDPSLFRKALSNIVMNAVQNTPEGGQIHIYAQEVNTSVRLCVYNNGVRIEEKMLRKLFEPFYREDKARSRDQGRSGLGLTIVKKALDFMGIPFALENAENGVLFRMDLPY
ncbi:MAG: HAMP domain-containing sensor histidine kinase [Paenibacillus dendritiformis]|uniref:HAMP domain-containing sensor histidine kinase n=1 Tax=uncultured Paenibacillus sp. TaxID=227322 RepID=UPI0025EE4381|nr:HAMP domain-containing sensor histidine kinase [uncultured Paenibacillus sp.]MDU5145514.1 HAMP domain-containing sensor histidine kinase [Paenibacillus dendritiformis]